MRSCANFYFASQDVTLLPLNKFGTVTTNQTPLKYTTLPIADDRTNLCPLEVDLNVDYYKTTGI